MSRELTREEKAAIRALVVKWCANYDRECGCLPLDCECYMLGKCWTGAYCRYFREAVLPLDPALEAALLTEGPRPDFKVCPVCGGSCKSRLPTRHTGRVTAPSAQKAPRMPCTTQNPRTAVRTNTVRKAPLRPTAPPMTPVASPLRSAYHFWAQDWMDG